MNLQIESMAISQTRMNLDGRFHIHSSHAIILPNFPQKEMPWMISSYPTLTILLVLQSREHRQMRLFSTLRHLFPHHWHHMLTTWCSKTNIWRYQHHFPNQHPFMVSVKLLALQGSSLHQEASIHCGQKIWLVRIRILMQTCMELSLSIWMWGRMGIVMEFYSWIAMAWMCFTMGIRWHIKWSEVSLTSISFHDHHHLRLWSSILDLLAGQHPCHTGLSVGPSVFFKASESLCCHLHFQGKCYVVFLINTTLGSSF